MEQEQKDLKSYTVEELNELVSKNADALSKTMGTKVFGLLLNTDGYESITGEWVIAYYKAPTLYQKMVIIDNVDKDKILKGWQLLEQNIIKEHSHMDYFRKEVESNHNIIIGAAMSVVGNSLSFSVNRVSDLKKNGE